MLPFLPNVVGKEILGGGKYRHGIQYQVKQDIEVIMEWEKMTRGISLQMIEVLKWITWSEGD